MKTLLLICRLIMIPLPFIGLLFTIHAEYEWYDRNKKWYLPYQIVMTLLLACFIGLFISLKL